MADYTKQLVAGFSSLRGASADPAVLDTEFNEIAARSGDKLDKSGGTVIGNLAVNGAVTITPAAAVTGETTRVMTARDVKHYAFSAGTRMAFFQASAPVGWTQVVTANDAMLRVVSGVGGGTGGISSPTNVVATTGPHALTVSEIPSHTHTFYLTQGTNGILAPSGSPYVAAAINSASGSYVDYAIPRNTQGAGSGAGHTHSLTWSPKYIDVIICSKD